MVEVWYDPKVVRFDQVLAHGRATDCARKVWTRDEKHHAAAQAVVGELALAAPAQKDIRLDKEQKYYLLQTPLADLPLSEAQACRVNANLDGVAYEKWLSPAQRAHAKELMKIAKAKQDAKASSSR